MTSNQEPPEAEPTGQDEAAQQSGDLLQEPARERPARQRRSRQEQNPALDPRLVQLERRAHRPSKAGEASLLLIGVVAFVFGVAMHFWVATSVLEDNGEAEPSADLVATATPEDAVTATPTVEAQATATAEPDRTSCDEIRGTQYRSVTEREFFLENCTGG